MNPMQGHSWRLVKYPRPRPSVPLIPDLARAAGKAGKSGRTKEREGMVEGAFLR